MKASLIKPEPQVVLELTWNEAEGLRQLAYYSFSDLGAAIFTMLTETMHMGETK